MIGENIRKRRTMAGMSQAEFATIMKVDQSAVSLWESDKTNPVASKIPVIAEVLGCTINDLFSSEKH